MGSLAALSHLPELGVRLPVGFRDATGRVHRDASLRKMTGHEEELLYDEGLNPGRLVTALLSACLTRIGELPAVDEPLVSQLYLADRNYLLLQLRRYSLGDQLIAFYRCPNCQQKVRQVEDLANLPTAELPEGGELSPVELELEDGFRDPQGVVHRTLSLAPPTGQQEELVGSIARRDLWRAQDALTMCCVQSFGTVRAGTLSGQGVAILRSLTLADRRRVNQALDTLNWGPDFRRSVQCGACDSRFEALLDASAFFVARWGTGKGFETKCST